MFYYVYILLLTNKDIYTGYSKDLKQRIKNHEQGKVESTRNFKPVKLIHYEAYIDKSDAKRREKFLKSSDGKALLKRQLSTLLSKLELK